MAKYKVTLTVSERFDVDPVKSAEDMALLIWHLADQQSVVDVESAEAVEIPVQTVH